MRTLSDNGSPHSKVPDELRRTNPRSRDLKVWLDLHARNCLEIVETWLVGSLPVPSRLIQAIWPDPDWRHPLENAVIMPLEAAPDASLRDNNAGVDEATDATPQTPIERLVANDTRAGFLRMVDPARGLGIVDVDGETHWLQSPAIAIPHPVLIRPLEAFRELAADLGYSQGLAQLSREIFRLEEQPAPPDSVRIVPGFLPSSSATRTPSGQPALSLAARIEAFQGGRFETLREAREHCERLGYRVRGSYAVTSIHERGRILEARFRIGSDDPDMPTETGELIWVNEAERQQPLFSIGPVAYSEGKRLASAIYARRTLEEGDLHG